ncbi:MAG TPA: hypothetical protein VKQ11_21705 [Candidatus Sulfotelmatobacter sp.]|nr:hypothetical protein [Candidatus Sulfotelmatobacter sp.]
MKKFFLFLLLCTVSSTFALADTPHASLTYVRRSHHKVQRHHAHKAAKHKAPKRKYHTV